MNGKELRRVRRRELDMTQSELATALGLSSQSISDFERGTRPIPKLLELAIMPLVENAAADKGDKF